MIDWTKMKVESTSLPGQFTTLITGSVSFDAHVSVADEAFAFHGAGKINGEIRADLCKRIWDDIYGDIAVELPRLKALALRIARQDADVQAVRNRFQAIESLLVRPK